MTAWTTATATIPFTSQPSLDLLFAASVLTVPLIVLVNTILCDIPDFEADHKSGVRGVTPRFGPRVGAIAAIACSGLGVIDAGIAGRRARVDSHQSSILCPGF